MAKLLEKIILSVIVVLFVGVGAAFLSAQFQEESTIEKEEVKEISIDEARQLALQAVDGEIVNIELEKDEYFPSYEIKMQKGNTFLELEINARTGNIVSIETEAEEEEELDPKEIFKLGGRVTEEEAKQIALNLVPGTVIDFEAEREGGLLLYGVTIKTGSDHVEIEVNAETGEILEVEWNED